MRTFAKGGAFYMLALSLFVENPASSQQRGRRLPPRSPRAAGRR